MMRMLFVIDPLDTLHAAKDSSVAMMRAAQQRGHEVWVTTPAELFWQTGEAVAARCQQLLVSGPTDKHRHPWYEIQASRTTVLHHFSAVLMRKDPPFDVEYITASWLLSRALTEGARVFNHPQALREYSEKLSLAEFPDLAPVTLVTRQTEKLHDFVDAQGDVIFKPLDGMGGRGVFRVRHDDPNRHVILETLSESGSRTVMAQRYLPAIAAGDKRILLIAGEVVPFALARIPKAGESRGNLAAGGTGVAQSLNPRDQHIAETLAPVLWQRGILLAGIDVIGEHLTEINITSPTCMVEIHAQTGFDVAALVIQKIEAICHDQPARQ